MNYIQATADTIIRYPFSRADLSTAHPNTMFSSNPTAEDLAPFNVFPVATTPRPADTRDERAVEGDPVLTDAGWQQVWTTRPATEDEQAAYDRENPPPPDWIGFAAVLALDPTIAAFYDSLPLPVSTGITAALSRCASGDTALFAALWQKLQERELLAAEVLEVIAAQADAHHLPGEFVAALTP